MNHFLVTFFSTEPLEQIFVGTLKNTEQIAEKMFGKGARLVPDGKRFYVESHEGIVVGMIKNENEG